MDINIDIFSTFLPIFKNIIESISNKETDCDIVDKIDVMHVALKKYNTTLEEITQFCLIELKHDMIWTDFDSVNEASVKVRNYKIDNILE
jgi:hypothetical protein